MIGPDIGLRAWLADLRLTAGTITKHLRRSGARMVAKPQTFSSADGVGALVAGEEARARAWGAELTELVRRA